MVQSYYPCEQDGEVFESEDYGLSADAVVAETQVSHEDGSWTTHQERDVCVFVFALVPTLPLIGGP